MIKIPFDRCVILTTLNFAQITNRLESVILNPRSASSLNHNSVPKHPRYLGEINGFKFLATRIVGHKYFHLPLFLLPTIEGKIYSFHHGHEISLAVKLHNVTCIFLMTWLGGLFMGISAVLDNILGDSRTYNYQYLTTIPIVILCYLTVLGYLYLDAWFATKFFKALFVKRFIPAMRITIDGEPTWSSDLSGELFYQSEPSTDLLRKNLPSFPSNPGTARSLSMTDRF
jgi:hypothetical protein